MKVTEQRVGNAFLVSTAGLIQETEKFSPKKYSRV
jgi:hypothetical protein